MSTSTREFIVQLSYVLLHVKAMFAKCMFIIPELTYAQKFENLNDTYTVQLPDRNDYKLLINFNWKFTVRCEC